MSHIVIGSQKLSLPRGTACEFARYQDSVKMKKLGLKYRKYRFTIGSGILSKRSRKRNKSISSS